jgi:cob(I)alamin adenosyltransferase
MSIVTKSGDQGTTGLMYNRRVTKCHPRVEAYGAIDELNSALGLARATAEDPKWQAELLSMQRRLVVVMGELATDPADLPRYERDGFKRVTPAMTARLEQLVRQIESRKPQVVGWAIPGNTLHSAALDFARTSCRHAERRVCWLLENDQLANHEILVFLNRFSDLLWLLARQAEQPSGKKPASRRRKLKARTS